MVIMVVILMMSKWKKCCCVISISNNYLFEKKVLKSILADVISFIVTVLEKDTAVEIKKLEKLEQEHPVMVGNLSKITVVTSV